MAVRQDKVQLNIEFVTDESRALAKVNTDMRGLTKELNEARRKGGDVADVMRRISEAGGKVEKLDLTRIAPDQLVTRARQLQRVLSKIPESAPGAARLQAEYKRINDRLANIRQNGRGVAQAFRGGQGGGLLGFLKSGVGQFLGFAAAAQAAWLALQNITQASAQFQKFEAVLTNTLGSKSEAKKALDQLTDFAAETPFQVDELIGSYIKLVNRGLKPTREELVQMADLTASQGKGFEQLTEAVLDAATGEFERLKEFGIKAKSQGDQVTLTFKDQEIQVAKTEAAITQAIIGFGKLNGVQGSTAAISGTLEGKISNLGDRITQMWKKLGEGIIGNGIGAAIDALSALAGWIGRVAGEEETRADVVRSSQADFNLQIQTLQRGNLTAQARAQLIAEINDKYGDYLPNLIEETATLGELKRAQELANRAFESRIILLAAEDRLADVAKRRLEAKRAELDLEREVTKAKEDQQTVEERQRANRTDPGFAGVGIGNNASGQVAANNLLADAIERANENKREQIRLEEEFQEELQVARELGADIDGVLNGGGSGGIGGGGGAGPTSKDPLGDALKRLKENFAQAALLAEQQRIREEISEQDYQRRLLELKAAEYQMQLDLFKKFKKEESLAAEEARTELLRAQTTLAGRGAVAVAELPGGGGLPGGVERRGVDSRLEAVDKQADKEAQGLQQARNERLINEDQFALARLQLKRNVMAQEIEILRTGNEAEVTLANEKAEQLKEIDQQLFDKRTDLAEREAALKQQLQQETTSATLAAGQAVIDLLGRDEEARKKNAKLIKAFEIGRIIIAGISELQQIRLAAAAQAGLFPALGPVILAKSIAQQVASGVQTAAAVAKVSSAKFARGGMPKFGVFGGKSHAAGGNRGYFEDGTQIEVERDETFAIVNKNARGLLAQLSAVNAATGGVPFFARGGVALNAPATTPRLTAGALAPAAPQQDNRELVDEIRALRGEVARSQRQLKAYVLLTDLTQAQGDMAAVEGASEV